MGFHRKGRGTEGQKKKRVKGRGRMQWFMKKEDKSLILIDVENVETTGERCCHLS